MITPGAALQPEGVGFESQLQSCQYCSTDRPRGQWYLRGGAGAVGGGGGDGDPQVEALQDVRRLHLHQHTTQRYSKVFRYSPYLSLGVKAPLPYLEVHGPVRDEGQENRENLQQSFDFLHLLLGKPAPVRDLGVVQQSGSVPAREEQGSVLQYSTGTSTEAQTADDDGGRSLPQQGGFLGFLGPAGEVQDLEHVGEGAAICWLGDEHRPAQEKDQEGDAQTDGRDDVAQLEAEVLLDVGHAPQGQDGPQVDAPVEPVEEPARGLWAFVFDLQGAHSQSTGLV